MEKTDFYTLLKKYADRWCESGHENRKRYILAICKEQPELLISHYYDKHYYGYAAELIYEIGYEAFTQHTEGLLGWLFIWLKDLNWPATSTITSILMTVPKNDMLASIKKILRTAFKDKDDMWIQGVCHIIRKAELTEHFLTDEEFKQILEFAGCLDNSGEKENYDFVVLDFDSEFQENMAVFHLTAFDLHFCTDEEIKSLVECTVRWDLEQTEECDIEYQTLLLNIREAYRMRVKRI